MPFRSAWLEFLCVLGGTVGLGLVFWVMGVGRADSPGAVTGAGCLVVLLFPLFPIVSFTTVGRVAHAQKMARRIDGVVASRYRSGNHNARSISVAGRDGSAVDVEGVDQAMWEAVSPGRSRLNKPAWSAAGELDGKVVRVVPRGYVMFFGPFRD